MARNHEPGRGGRAGRGGAAGIIRRKSAVERIVLVDTTALSLGTAVHGTMFSRVIDANTRIPCTRTNEYAPVADFQPGVVIGVYQGESELVAGNLKLGEVELLFDPPRPREEAVVDVTFHLDANDILHVTAKDRATGAAQGVTIKDSQNLDRETVDRLKCEARRSRSPANWPPR
jgi:molecular chaperone DnaK